MNKLGKVLIGCGLVMLLGSCAFDLVHVKQIPIQLQSAQSPKNPFVLEQEVNVSLGTGYSRVLKKGTEWRFVGTIPNGDVYSTDDQVLTVEASNIYEAYIVVSSGKLVGFYLPVGKSFSPLADVKALAVRELVDE
jgi:hypothetical protein